jgi:hypothetical protein
MNQITPYPVWVGHTGDSNAFRKLFDQGIQAVVHLAIEELPAVLPRELICLRFPILDGGGNEDYRLDLAIHSIVLLIEKGIPTLVCCDGGMSRSPALVAAALAQIRQTSLEECMEYVAACHPADVSPSLWADIRAVSQGHALTRA